MNFRPRVTVVLIVAAVLAACAGTNFARLSGPQLRLGLDTEASLRQRLGSSYKEGAVTKNDRQFKTLAYAYSSAGGKPAVQGVTPGRGQTFYLLDGILVGHDFSSSWAEDSTNFDDSKIPEIVIGKSKVADVVRLLGEPGGEYIYPLASQIGERDKVYSYNQVSGSAFSLRIHAKSLIVSYDENDVVTDLEFTKSGQE